MRATKYLFTPNDVRNHFSGLTSSSYSLPALKPGIGYWPSPSNKCFNYPRAESQLLVNIDSREYNLPTWDDLKYTIQTKSQTFNGMWDSWGGNWATVRFYSYNGNRPFTPNAWNFGFNLGAPVGWASVILEWKVSGNWWSGWNTNWVWSCRRSGNGGQWYGCFNDTRPNNTNCGNWTTVGNISRNIGNATPKGCVLAIVPYNGWIGEQMLANNVGAGDARVTYTIKYVNIVWPY